MPSRPEPRPASLNNRGGALAPLLQTLEANMSVTTLLIIILILMLVGVLPHWGYSSGWGYSPVGVILVIILILLLVGRL